jgi:hypothetical protein
MLVPVDVKAVRDPAQADMVIFNWNSKREAIGEEPYLPEAMERTITHQKKQYTMNDEEYSEATRIAGEMAYNILTKHTFSNISDPTANDIAAVKSAVSRGREVARYRMLQRVVSRSSGADKNKQTGVGQ